MKATHRLVLVCSVGLVMAAVCHGQVIRGETPTGGFVDSSSIPTVRDRVPPEIVVREPVQVATRSIKPLEPQPPAPTLSTRSSSVVIRGVARDSAGIASVTVQDREPTLLREPDGVGFSASVPLILGENRINIVAADRAGNQRFLTLIVNRELAFAFGKHYALLIAVEKYDDSRLESLTGPIRDAESLKTVLQTEYEFDPANIRILKNPTRQQIQGALYDYRKLTRDDNLLIFYAGHGHWDEEMNQGYWLPANATKDDPAEWLSNSTIRDYVRAIKTQHTLLISDACFSGTIFQERGKSGPDLAVEKIYELRSRHAITSGQNTVPDQSVFLSYLVQQLRENRSPYLTAQTLFVNLKTAVINNSPVPQVPRYGVIQGADDVGGGDYVFSRR